MALILLAIADLAPLLKAQPDLAKELGAFVEQQRVMFAGQAGTAFSGTAGEGQEALLQRIERFFRFS